MLEHKKTLPALIASLAFVSAAPAHAYVQPISMEVNQTYYLTTATKITRIAVANPKIADVTVVGPSAINIVSFEAGTTTVTVWLAGGAREEYSITVTTTDSGMAKLIQEAIDLPHVKVQKVGNKVLLRGKVENQYEKDLAVKIASMYLNDAENTNDGGSSKSRTLLSDSVTLDDSDATNPNVINLLEMTNPEQINFEAVIMEINSDDSKRIGLTYGSPEGGAVSDGNGVSLGDNGFFYFGESYGQHRSPRNHWYTRNWLFSHFSQINMNLRLLVEQDKARVISRPNVTTMSGKTAGIHLGGTVLYPKSNGNSSTAIEEKEYGIRLNLINPSVDREGNVTARLYAAVSAIDNANGITVDGYTIPALRERAADTMVNIPTGMTMVIGGLLNSEEADNIQRIPFLSKLPFIGELFKYHYKTRNKSEIIILITPHVVNETTPVRMSNEMRDYYRESRLEDENMNDVYVNDPVTASDKKDKKSSADNRSVVGQENRTVHLLGQEPAKKSEAELKAKAEEEAAAKKAEEDRIAEEKAKAKAEKEELERKRREPQPKESEKEDSIIGRYLNQKVLTAATEEETEAAMR